MAVEMGQSHRPGMMKQQNKTHKHGKHGSKRSLDRASKGRVSAKVATKTNKRILNKRERKNKAAQVRQMKREETLSKKRCSTAAPHLLTILPLSDDLEPDNLVTLLQGDSEDVEGDGGEVVVATAGNNSISHYIISSRYKMTFSVMTPPSGDTFTCLDAAKASDSLLLLLSPSEPLSGYGQQLLTMLLAQGLPSTHLTIQDMDTIPHKKHNEVKKIWERSLQPWLSDIKVGKLSTRADALMLLRQVSCQRTREVKYRQSRAYLVVEEVQYIPKGDDDVGGNLEVTGYVRGSDWQVNRVVHVVGGGDFHLSHITRATPPHANTKVKGLSMDTSSDSDEVLAEAEPSRQQDLAREVEADPMCGEQTWPTLEEMAQAGLEASGRKVKRVPKGTSEYQATWILDDEDEDEDSSESEDDEDGGMMDTDSQAADNHDGGDDDDGDDHDGEENDSDDDEEYETMTVTEGGDPANYDQLMDMDEEKRTLSKYEFEEAQRFPDEVDTPLDIPARQRFARYRGLQSFRSSDWDSKENLPPDYARIFQFEDFNRTRRKVLREESEKIDGVGIGTYVTLHIKDVPKDVGIKAKPHQTIYSLLPHEHRMSVLHFLLKKHESYSDPVVSKERLVFVCGGRVFSACPVFSQHTVGSKHKYEKYMCEKGCVVASVYAPITFPPAPVLVFKEADGASKLVATGSLLSVSPDRLVIKRVILSGHPYKINRRSAVIRYMFFNREDINWFKPVELVTKYGRRGHIKEPLGTHGHMKCIFDKPLKSQDTVLMKLYKRVYPKWTYEPLSSIPGLVYK